ncbi:S8 family peptidase [Glycomyces tenuis]|uniref:S8 family peptidase n=1 Tax=Glycomyces tenuis TaxID=58116 RepID=UPI0004197EEC|nr:S8 family serine peptidase [Glycomyces tenuis]
MATPLDPTPPKRRYRLTESSSRARLAVGAGIGTLALAGAIVATPGAAIAQDGELEAANQWVTDQIQAPAAWETTQGEGVTVAVVDMGVSEHPYFEGKDIQPGYSTYSDEEDAWNDAEGHGTAVTSMVLNVAPAATILPVRINNGAEIEGLTGGAGESAAIEGIRWAADNGADVVALPWVSVDYEPSEEYLGAIQYAIDMGAVVVAGAGNDPALEGVPAPASIPGVVAVAGTDQSGNSWDQSTTGEDVEVSAPASGMTVAAVQEESLGWGDDTDQELYRESTGTSLATGITSGVVALILSANQDIDGNNAIQRLIQTAGSGGGSDHTEELGYGVINADQAVNAGDIETVEENPLGYPLGEPGASGAEAEEEGAAEGSGEGSSENSPSVGAAEQSGTGLSTIIIVAAAVVLVGAAIAVWLVLRGRSRKQAAEAGPPGGFGGEGAPAQGGYPQTGQVQPPQYGPPPGGGQNFSPPPPTGGQQHYSPPMNTGESSPPWGPGSDPNQRR